MPFPTTFPSTSVMLNGAFGIALVLVASVRFTRTVVFPNVVFCGVATIVTSLGVTAVFFILVSS